MIKLEVLLGYRIYDKRDKMSRFWFGVSLIHWIGLRVSNIHHVFLNLGPSDSNLRHKTSLYERIEN